MSEVEKKIQSTGVLVVHGIGFQERGETLNKLLGGLRRIDAIPEDLQEGMIATVGRQPVRFYEVYWADLLKGEMMIGAFQMKELQSLSWFPLLNSLRGEYRRGRYSFVKLAWWCVALPIINFLVLLAYYGIGFFAQLVSGTKAVRKEAEDDTPLRRVGRKVVGQSTKLTCVDVILDEFVGDVFSYLNSAGKAFHRDADEPPLPPELEHVYPQIIRRFYDQLVKAQADGCETIQVVAHSLGSVVTYHALSGFRFEAAARADADAIRSASAGVRHFYTIGSPLEKIRFFWPRLTPDSSPLGGASFQWDNFVSWFDPVAGAIRSFEHCGDLTNHYLLGGGFLRGHVVYERSRVFLNAFTLGLTGCAIPFRRTFKERWQDLLVLVGETLLAPGALVCLLLVGAALFALTAMILPFLLSLLVRPFLPTEVWAPILDTSSLIVLSATVLIFLLAPLIRAKRVHSLYWATSSSESDELEDERPRS